LPARTPKQASDYLDQDDQYQLDLIDGVEDDSLNDHAKSMQFSISSYGVDYTVDTLIKRVKTNAFFVPPFQRDYVWSHAHASAFIESLLLGLPVPGIFLYKEPGTNRHLIIDGQQRLKSLHYFINEKTFADRKFKLIDVTEPWNGKTFDELTDADRLRIEDSVVHTTVFQQDEPKAGDQSVYYVFQRINSGGIRLSSQEIRSCVNYGPFATLIRELNKYKAWREIYGSPNRRLKDQELILRFLALEFALKDYSRPMSVFLNKFMENYRTLPGDSAKKFKSAFEETIAVAAEALGDRPFRPERAINAAVFDAVMVGLSRRRASGPIKKPQEIRDAYDALLAKKEFRQSYERATADEENVKARIRLATESFSHTY
jgi:uncharacterized protein DUF262